MTGARPLRTVDLPEVVDVVTSAFADYPYWRWLVDDPAERDATMRAYYAADLAPLLASSSGIEAAGRLAGVAIWIRSDAGPGFDATSTAAAGGPAAARMAHALEVMASMAPVEAHWYLDVLAVRPEHQGTGLGRAVVGPGLARADGDGLGCYLETGKAENLAFYRAAGFEVTAERDVAEIGLLGPAGRGLHLWGMWRAAT